MNGFVGVLKWLLEWCRGRMWPKTECWIFFSIVGYGITFLNVLGVITILDVNPSFYNIFLRLYALKSLLIR